MLINTVHCPSGLVLIAVKSYLEMSSEVPVIIAAQRERRLSVQYKERGRVFI